MNKIRQILDAKGSQVWTVGSESTVYDALSKMAEKEVGALVVIDGERVVGVLSERDYARKVILQGRSSLKTQVGEIMTRRVAVTHPDAAVDECMALMTDKRIRHLPVFDGERLAGLVSIGDLVKAIIAEQKFQIEQLERYISS